MRPPAVVAPSGIWLNMVQVKVKPLYLVDLEIESMKTFKLVQQILSIVPPDNFFAL